MKLSEALQSKRLEMGNKDNKGTEIGNKNEEALDEQQKLCAARRHWWVSQARRGGCRSWGFCWWVGSRDGEGDSPKVPLTRLSVAVVLVGQLSWAAEA